MWPFAKTTSPHRAERSRNGSGTPKRHAGHYGEPKPAQPSRWRRFRQAGGVGALALAAGLYAVVLALDAVPLQPLPYRLGQYVPRDLYARVPFQVHSPKLTEEQRKAAVRRAPAIIVLDEAVLQRIVGELKNLPGKLKSATRPADLDKQLAEGFRLVTEADLAKFAQYADPEKAPVYNAQIDRLREVLLQRVVVPGSDYASAFYEKDAQEIRVGVGGAFEYRPKTGLVSVDSVGLREFVDEAVRTSVGPALAPHLAPYLQKALSTGEPLFRLDRPATALAEEAARRAVGPVSEAVPAGTLLAARSTDTGLDEPAYALLAAEHEAFIAAQKREDPFARTSMRLGRAGTVALVLVGLCLYVVKYRPRLAGDHRRGPSVAAVMVLTLVFSKVIAATGQNPLLAVFGMFLAAVIFTIACDGRFALALTAALALLTALQLRLGLTDLLALWVAAGTAIFQLREIRTRTKLIEVGGVTAMVVFVAVTALQAISDTPLEFMLVNGAFAAVAAFAGGFLAQGVLPLVERTFRVATSLTLLEWCDLSKPLLKRLALDAGGTYNHSLMLGSLCESAADTIGARGLLARVGAYYHDIGKINKPPYFVENQTGPASRHDRLSPAMSLLVIKGHVKDGLELAREYGLPQELHEFIATHHGTTLVEYFYHAASQRKDEADRALDEVEFRYGGPKPRSKEAAILMLADAAESAVRALGEHTPGRIETQVHQIASKRLTDGQLDECDLTLREVHAIEASLTKSLTGMYHGRIQYPSQRRPDEDEEDKRPPGPASPSEPAAAPAETTPREK